MRVLVIRLSAMGDVAISVPIVKAFVQQYPDAQITLLSRPFFYNMFAGVKNIKTLPLDLKHRHKGFAGLIRLFRDIKAESDFDFVIDLHDVLRTKILSFLFRLQGTIVFTIDKDRKKKKKLVRQQKKILKPLTPSFRRYANVFAAAGFPLDLSLMQNFTSDFSIYKPDFDLSKNKKPNIGIAPFARHKAKAYPVELMKRVVEKLQTSHNIYIFGGGDTEKSTAEKWQTEYENVHSLIGKINLKQELAFIQMLDLILTMDSANMHLAALTGTKILSIWGATHPFAGFVPFGQDNASTYIQIPDHKMPCRPCSVFGSKPCFRNDYACLTQISSDEIVERVQERLK